MSEKRITVVIESDYDPAGVLHKLLEMGSDVDGYIIEEEEQL